MKGSIRSKALKFGIPFVAVTAMVLGSAVPGWADTPTPTATPTVTSPAAIHAVEGKVISIAADKASFVIQNGSKPQVTVKVDANTQYYLIPTGRAKGLQDKLEDRKDNQGNGNKPDITGTKPPAVTVNPRDEKKPLPPKAQENRPATTPKGTAAVTPELLGRLGKSAQFSDIQIDDRVVARVTADNLAKTVLIIKGPVNRTITGTVSAVTATTITITPATGTAVVLNWDNTSRFELYGVIAVQAGQRAVATYNRNTMKLHIMKVHAPAPAPTPTPTPTVAPTTTPAVQ